MFKNTTIAIMKKEMNRIFTDKKLFFSTVILPGLMMFLIYTLMGTFMTDLFTTDEDHTYQIYAVNLPASAQGLLEAAPVYMEITHIPEEETDRIKQSLSDREADLLLVFPPYFDEAVEAFDLATATEPAPNIEIWANTAHPPSADARHNVTALLNSYHHSLAHTFNINAPSEAAPDGNFNLATDADMFAMTMGIMIPMIFMIFLFSGSQSIVPESIAGEKERGTLGSMLVTPASRSGMALGKILGLGIFALLSAIGSFLGIILSMPALMDMDGGMGSILEFFAVSDLLLIVIIAVSTTLVFVALLSVLSAYAKSVKESNAYAMPLMLVIMAAGLAGALFGGAPEGFAFYLIPIVNSALSITAVFSFEIITVNIIVAAAANFALAIALTLALARIFSSEKIVFDK